MAEPLATGSKAADFTLPSHLDGDVSLSDLLGPQGKNVVVFFYPLDLTPV
jgi:peroxiredoxin